MEKTQLDYFETILEKENELVTEIAAVQKDMREAVQSKSWENLTGLINKMNESSEKFSKIDSERDSLQKKMTSMELKAFSEKLLFLRSKLSQSKIENRVLNDYINITRGFINGVLDNASTKTSSRYGQIVQTHTVSVLVSANC